MRTNGKKRIIALNALLVLALVLSFVAPAMAQDDVSPAKVGNVVVTPDPDLAGEAAAYTVEFDINEDLSDLDPDYIYITFPSQVVVGDGNGDITVNTKAPGSVVVNGEKYKIEVPDGGLAPDDNPITVVFSENEGLVNPGVGGTYELKVETSEETPGTGEFLIETQPVVVWLKKQVPEQKCGYTMLEPLKSFQDIQTALDFANDVWKGDTVYPTWNLFSDCPNLPDITDEDLLDNISGVPVGAVLTVGPGTYSETIEIDTPGVILASLDGADATIIDAADLDPVELDGYGRVITGAVGINAGGVTFGASTMVLDEDGTELNLGGFTVKNAGQMAEDDDVDANGVAVFPWGEKSERSIYAPTVEAYGVITEAMGSEEPYYFETDEPNYITTTLDVDVGDKIVNLTNQWGVHVDGEAKGWFTTDITVTDHFTNGDVVAVFSPYERTWSAEARVDVRENVIHDSTLAGIGAFATGALWVDGNEAYNNATDGFYGEALWAGGVVVCDGIERSEKLMQISNNNFHNNGDGSAADWTGADGCFTQEGDGGDDAGIHLAPWWEEEPNDVATLQQDGPEPGKFSIVGNVLEANTHAGIWLGGSEYEELWYDLKIVENKLLNNGVFGLAVEKQLDWWAGKVNFEHNNIEGNGSWGVKDWNEDFVAKWNYWGMPGGPSAGPEPCIHEVDQRSEAMGNGDAVNAGVHYDPWLTESYVTVLADDVRWYGSELALEGGWNTLGMPVDLHSAGDTFDDLAGLGGYLDALTGTNYWYDASGGGWTQIVGSTVLQPGKGFYVRMSEDTAVPVLYNGDIGPLPSYPVYEGWNLVGSMFGIDKNYNEAGDQGMYGVASTADPDGQKDAMLVLESLGDSYAQAVSPGLPGQTHPAPWSLTKSQIEAQPSPMYTGEAYWVFMKEEAMLAGFEVTPLYY